MSHDISKGKWLHLRGKCKHHGSEVTEGDASRQSHHEYVVRKLQERYGMTNQDVIESEPALH